MAVRGAHWVGYAHTELRADGPLASTNIIFAWLRTPIASGTPGSSMRCARQ